MLRQSHAEEGRIHNAICVFFEVFAALVLLLTLFDMLLQVSARAFFPRSAPAWTEEAARIALVWATFIGASAASLRRMHLVVDFFDFASVKVKLVWDLVIAAAVAWLCVSLIQGGWTMVQMAGRSTTPGLGWPGSVYYIPLVIFAVATFYACLHQVLRNLLALFR
jgi:TRAP-type transport system small permease protein